MRTQYARYEALGWNYRLPLPDVTSENGELTAVCPINGGTVRYTLDGSAPTVSSPALVGPIPAKLESFRAISVGPDGKRASLIWEKAK